MAREAPYFSKLSRRCYTQLEMFGTCPLTVESRAGFQADKDLHLMHYGKEQTRESPKLLRSCLSTCYTSPCLGERVANPQIAGNQVFILILDSLRLLFLRIHFYKH